MLQCWKSHVTAHIELNQKFPLETDGDANNSDKQLCRWHHEGVLNFCKDAWSNTIEEQGVAVSVEELFTLLDIAGSDRKEFVSAFMDTKKSHEVDIMSYVCVHLFKSTGCKLVSILIEHSYSVKSWLILSYQVQNFYFELSRG